jgi:hypothetical protein
MRFEAQCEAEGSLDLLRMNIRDGTLSLTAPATEAVGAISEVPILCPVLVCLVSGPAYRKWPGLKLNLELREREYSYHNCGVDENADPTFIGQTLEGSIPGKDVDQGRECGCPQHDGAPPILFQEQTCPACHENERAQHQQD